MALVKLHARADLSIIEKINERLKGANIYKFGNSCFAPFLKMRNMNFHGQLYLHLLFSQDTTRSMKKIVFHIANREAEFGPREFALVTGLKFGAKTGCPPTSQLYKKFFKNLKQRVDIRDIERAFKKVDGESEDCLKLGLLWILYGVLLAQRKDSKKMDMQYIDVVDNLEEFNEFPWGRVAFEFLVHDIRRSIGIGKKGRKSIGIDCNGFAYALQCWAFEAMSSVAILCGSPIKLDNKIGLPRMLWWDSISFTTFKQLKKRAFIDKIECDLLTDNIIVHHRLDPFEFEMNSLSYVSAVKWEEDISLNSEAPRPDRKRKRKVDDTDDEEEEEAHEDNVENILGSSSKGGDTNSLRKSVKQLILQVQGLETTFKISRIEERQQTLETGFTSMMKHFGIEMPQERQKKEKSPQRPPQHAKYTNINMTGHCSEAKSEDLNNNTTAPAALCDLMPEIRAHPSLLLAEFEDVKHVMDNACSKEKEPEATITGLTHKNKTFSAQCASYENQIVVLEAENKETKEELTVAHRKEKELEATISRLTHKNKVFSAQCASYESQVVALEVENKKTKEELMNADKKYYAGARAAGYAEGLKEGKAKWLRSTEFFHHLTDASMQYFDYGFDSCQKQAEQQGFVGQLNKDSALKEAPQLKGWESSNQPH
ncbi:hypothetical protein ACS0TY_015317 [Phlomoides rotata]